MEGSPISIKVGTTRSGVAIFHRYETMDGGHRNIHLQPFSSNEDYFDAYSVFEYLSSWENRKERLSREASEFSSISGLYRKIMGAENFQNEMLKIGLTTSAEIVIYGETMVLACFREPFNK